MIVNRILVTIISFKIAKNGGLWESSESGSKNSYILLNLKMCLSYIVNERKEEEENTVTCQF
jgi:hypothetical protein